MSSSLSIAQFSGTFTQGVALEQVRVLLNLISVCPLRSNLMPIALPLQWRDPGQWVFLCAGSFVRGISCFMRYIGVFCVGAGMLLIFLVGGLLMYAIIPIMAESTLELICHVVVAMVLLFNIYFNYALCCATDPGVITSKWKEETALDEVIVNNATDDHEGEEGRLTDRDVATVDEEVLPRIRPTAVTLEGKNASRLVPVSRVQLLDPHSVARQRSGNERSYCRQCRHFRPRRAHHCSVCNRCIAHLDHHCPWVNNCIGRNNYRYFFTFLVWLAVGAYYAAYLSYSAVYAGLSHEQFMRLLVIFETHSATMILTFAFTISSSGGVAVSILATWHAFLIVTAQTSVEWRINRRRSHKRLYGGKGVSPYSSGTMHGNWEQVFGRCDFKILSLMPSTRRIPNLQVLDKKTKRMTHDVVDSERATPFDDIV